MSHLHAILVPSCRRNQRVHPWARWIPVAWAVIGLFDRVLQLF